MDLHELTSLYAKHPNTETVQKWLEDKNDKFLQIAGLAGSSCALLTAAAAKNENIVFILNDEEEAAYFYNDLMKMSAAAYFFPSSYKRAIKYGQIDSANEILRTETLSKIENDKQPSDNLPLIIVSYPEAVTEKVIPPEQLKDKTLNISVGERLDTEFIIEILNEYGFERVDFVYEAGQFSVRGGIIDVFSYSHELPYRIDFFGNEVDSIREFDIETQLSKERKESISIVSKLKTDKKESVSLFEFIKDENTVLFFKNIDYVKSKIAEIFSENETADIISDIDFLAQIQRFRRGVLHTPSNGGGVQFHTSPQPLFHKNFDLVADSLKRSIAEGYTLYICSDSKKQTDRIAAIFEDRGDNIKFIPVLNTLHEGFIDHDLKVCVYTDHQIFDRFHKFNLKSDKARAGKAVVALKELNQLQLGDYVTHIDHGIGKFGGLIKTNLNGTMQEVVKLVYKDDDIIFVSIHALHRISKYKGKEGEPPRINKLGTGAWQALKERTKKKVKDIARDLIKLYAKRKAEQGFAYSPDTYLQQELEASFIYEDTPDQVRATADVKKDMQSPRPMDRLICGDVGFGKTEIAVRAAFKAATDGKQAAVLVPTTVLALQHYKTFGERLKDFPVRIEYLSRARSGAKTKEIVEDLKEGKIDIVIGTHKLIGKTVQFKDLGLLVIDEEQKFGVAVKEKLKQLKANVDTLTMTATPIPRTLQFSLMGARDLSVMHTPPPNRYPVQTELHEFNEDIIREAILHEIGRNGQVFFVNNRIESIYQIEKMLHRIVPEARVAVGHGQMDSDKLEEIITDFIDYEYDVLVATTIIESGIDIPNANTIIINKAQNFGLSDLHQLRGRVGRSNRKAYCYLLAPPMSDLTSEARRRLQAIENFAELGSGFNIAMQDLDIRGAGNMLGAEQSGFIADLGYETYQKILNEAMHELQEEEFSDIIENKFNISECIIESDLDLMFPHDYIESVSERMTLYRELDNITDECTLQAFEQRLIDRFGKIPQEACDLIQTVRLRFMAVRLGIEKLTLKNERMVLYIGTKHSPQAIINYAIDHPRNTQLREQGGKRSLVISPVKTVAKAYGVLEEMTTDIK
ncbi:MAG: transcription-repair coupling factor [Prevotellaceae bacterium]|jgi:transcription-repair coupling factor (superfamily II helicase)|nr:transcription-repair coupling factor [Prevotellaceae bacterium]